MSIFLAGLFATFLASQTGVASDEGRGEELQRFVDQGWGFQCRRSDGGYVVRAVSAHRVEQAGVRTFLGSLEHLERLNIGCTTFGPGDIRSLARHCPSLRSIRYGDTEHANSPKLEAALWPEFFQFKGLKHLSVRLLHCSGDEQWRWSGSAELETLAMSGNLSGVLSSLLAACETRHLRIELVGPGQQLTAADYAAIRRQTALESLEILGDIHRARIVVGLDALSGLKQLRRLTLRRCLIDPQMLRCLPALETLSLQACLLAEHGFPHVLNHPGLKELVLWECNAEDLHIAGPFTASPQSLREITLRFPELADIKLFHSLPCIYHVELGVGGPCGRTGKGSILRSVGRDEVASLGQLNQLRTLALVAPLKVSDAALVQAASIDTLRSLRISSVDIVERLPKGSPRHKSDLEEVRFLTNARLSREFFERFLGRDTRVVSMGDCSGDGKDDSPRGNATRYRAREVGLVGITFPVKETELESRLLGSSTKVLVLESCDLNQGAVQQLVSNCPSLERLTLDLCYMQDERELLHLNKLTDLKCVDLTDTGISAGTALSIKAESIRFREESWRWTVGSD